MTLSIGQIPTLWSRAVVTIPNLPTDNLYKFVALSGVAFCIATSVVPVLAFRHHHEKMRLVFQQDFENRQEAARLEMEALGRLPTDPEAAMPIVQLLKTHSERVHENGKLAIEMLKDEAEFERRLLDGMLTFYRYAAPSMLIGFVLWWLQVQRYQDRILRSEAEKSSTTVNSGRHSVA